VSAGRFALILPAAGTGARMGTRERKTLLRLAGRPLLFHTLERFAGLAEIAQTVLVVHPDDLARYRRLLPALLARGVTDVVAGGARRQDSVEHGLAAVRPEIRWVAVHDAARPLVSPDAVRRCLAAARARGAAVLGVPAVDTLKRVRADGTVAETLDRARVWAIQTPQAFRRDWLARAYAHARARGLTVTDDAALLEAHGRRVTVVMGEYGNVKITTPADLALARGRLARTAK
jgi:2-C-methyl-D-erythritol 4-phosphate cytidylyltransferase